MKRTPPRRLTFRGTMAAAGLIVGAPLDEAGRRERILRSWRAGATVYRLADDGAYLLLWPEATTLRADRAPGQPVLRCEDQWWTAPLEADERQGTAAQALLRVRRGRVDEVDLSTLSPVDPSAWLHLGPLDILAVEPLGPPPPPPKPALPPVELDVRAMASLPGVDVAQQQAILRALRGEAPGPAPPGVETRGWRAQLQRWLKRLEAWLRGRTRATGRPAARPARGGDVPTDGPKAGGSRRSRSPEGTPRRPPWWSSRLEQLADWLSRLGHRIVGAWHQRYLDRLVEMFESGRLQDALRHAIPMGGDRPSRGPALRPPRPRRDLELRPRGEGPARVIMGPQDVWEQLRRFYRRAANQLIFTRRLKEAAFVLAELLGEKLEAVAMLEREGEPKLAAELAEAAQLDPGLRVRLWAQAGDWERATRLARQHGVFGAAVSALEATNQPAADKLRALWAAHRAETGDFVGAIELVWPRAKPSQAWIDAALAMGGGAAARVIPKQLALVPAAFERVRDLVETMLQDPSPEGEQSRRALAHAFVAAPDPPGVPVLARALTRRLVAERAPTDSDIRLLGKLVKVANDGPLAADLPPAKRTRRPSGTATLTLPAFDRGLVAVHDAARLPSGRLLVALGEAGVLFTTADGRPLSHLRVPATRLVPSDTGHRALAVVPRGRLSQIHRLDLVRWRATTWCELPLGAYASSFDGWSWFATVGPSDQLMQLDVTGARPDIEWNSGVVRPARVARDASLLTVLRDEGAPTLEIFEVPGPRLRQRLAIAPIDDAAGPPLIAAVAAAGHAVLLSPNRVAMSAPTETAANPRRAVRRPGDEVLELDVSPGAGLWAADASSDDLAVVMAEVARDGHPGVLSIRGGRFTSQRPWLRLELEGSKQGGVRAGPRYFTVWDDLGRVVVADAGEGRIEQVLRIRL